MNPNKFLILALLVISIFIMGCNEADLSGLTTLPDIAEIGGEPELSPADKCNKICSERGYENWALLALVEEPGEFECKCTFLDCSDSTSGSAVIRTCNPTSHIYPVE